MLDLFRCLTKGTEVSLYKKYCVDVYKFVDGDVYIVLYYPVQYQMTGGIVHFSDTWAMETLKYGCDADLRLAYRHLPKIEETHKKKKKDPASKQ